MSEVKKILGDTLLSPEQFDNIIKKTYLKSRTVSVKDSNIEFNNAIVKGQNIHTRKEIAKVIKLKRDELNQGFQHDETSKKECLFRYAEFLNQLIKELEG